MSSGKISMRNSDCSKSSFTNSMAVNSELAESDSDEVNMSEL